MGLGPTPGIAGNIPYGAYGSWVVDWAAEIQTEGGMGVSNLPRVPLEIIFPSFSTCGF